MRFVGIDPSTKTGFVALDSFGNVLKAKELKGVGKEDPKRMATLITEIMDHVQKDDVVCIEGFGYASQQAIQLGGIGWGIRMALHQKGLKYYEVSPNSVKKFVNVSGWTGTKGKMERLTGTKKKRAVMEAVHQHFGFEHRSDNVVDAYILAQIAFWLHDTEIGNFQLLPYYQGEVIHAIREKAVSS
jgi:crossover junction endodeoxyribonuclease RuvC